LGTGIQLLQKSGAGSKIPLKELGTSCGNLLSAQEPTLGAELGVQKTESGATPEAPKIAGSTSLVCVEYLIYLIF